MSENWQDRALIAEQQVKDLREVIFRLRRTMHHEARNLDNAAEKLYRRPCYLPKTETFTWHQWFTHAYKFHNWLRSSAANLRRLEQHLG